MRPNPSLLIVTPAFALALTLAAVGCTHSSDAPGPDAGPAADAGADTAAPAPDTGAPPSDGGVVPPGCPAPTGGPTVHPGSISADETWTANTSPHVLPYDTSIYAKVTLEPCAVVQIAPRVTVTIPTKGALVGAGTATKPILIGARDAGKPWAVIRAIGGSAQLAYVTIEGGGDPLNTSKVLAGMLYGQPGSDPVTSSPYAFALKNVTLKGSASNGVVMNNVARFSDDSAALTVTGSAEYPVSIYPRVVGTLPTGTYTGNASDEILLPGGGQGEVIVESTTMHERGVPYHVGHATSAGELRVGSSTTGAPLATLTIEPGVVVRFKKGGYFKIEEFSSATPATGALIANGTAAKPIRFTSAEAAPAIGDWIGLTFGSKADPTNALDNVWVEYAGMQDSGGTGSCATGLRVGAILISGIAEPDHAFITNSKIIHSPVGIISGWSGTQIDFSATNTFDDVAGCKLTNPKDGSNSCNGRPPCAVN